MRRYRPWLLASAPVLAVVLGYVALHSYEVVSKGPAPDAADSILYHLRVFGVALEVVPEVKPSPDVLNSYLLVVGSTLSFGAAVLIALNRPQMVRVVRLLAIVGAGALYLAADELMAFHENIGRNLPWLADLPGVTHPDDVIPLLYGLIALAVIVRFRDVIFAAQRAIRLFAVAGGLFVVAALLDVADLSQALEDFVEVASTCTGLIAFGALLVHHLRLAGVVPEADSTLVPRADPPVEVAIGRS
jgi:hypothetical protein